jgi:hypothetical protein
VDLFLSVGWLYFRAARPSAVVPKESFRRASVACTLDHKVLEQMRRLRPERAKALLSPLPRQPHLVRLYELEIARPEVQHFLDARPAVEHRGQKRVVASPVRRRSIDRIQHGLDLFELQVLDRPWMGALEGDAEDSLTLLESLRMPRGDIAEKRV